MTTTGRAPVPRTPWTLDMALEFFRDVEPVLAHVGWHAAIAGGVPLTGESEKDLDLVVFPHKRGERRPNKTEIARLHAALRSAGAEQLFDVVSVRTGRRWQASGDQKHVEIWLAKGRRVDILVLS